MGVTEAFEYVCAEASFALVYFFTFVFSFTHRLCSERGREGGRKGEREISLKQSET